MVSRFAARAALAAALVSSVHSAAAQDCQQRLDAAMGKIWTSGPVRMGQYFVSPGQRTLLLTLQFVPPDRYSHQLGTNPLGVPGASGITIGDIAYTAEPGGTWSQQPAPPLAPGMSPPLWGPVGSDTAGFAIGCTLTAIRLAFDPEYFWVTDPDALVTARAKFAANPKLGKDQQERTLDLDPAGRPVRITGSEGRDQYVFEFTYDLSIKIEPPPGHR